MKQLVTWQGSYDNRPLMLTQYGTHSEEVLQQLLEFGLTEIKLIPTWKTRFISSKKGNPAMDLFTHLERLLLAQFLLPQCLELIIEHSSCPWRSGYAWFMLVHLIQGKPLCEAIKKLPDYSSITHTLIKISHNNHQLATMMGLCNQRSQQLKALENQIRQAMLYPVFILVIALSLSLLLILFLLPTLITQMNQPIEQLPFFTRILYHISWTLKHQSWLLLAIVILLYLTRSPSRSSNLGLLLWRCPYKKVRIIAKMHYLIPWGQALAHLIEARFSLLESLKQCQSILPDQVMQEYDLLIEHVEQGFDFIEGLSKTSFFPCQWLSWVALGYQAQTLPERLSDCVKDAWTDYQQQLKQFSTLIEPLLMLCVGALLACMLVAIYLPMMTLNIGF
jgi:type II secretory pathway component PulF